MSWKGKWAKVFGNDNPLIVEIGTGRGSYLTRYAAREPGINFVGIELYSNPLYRAVKKAEELELPNVRFIRINAEFLTGMFEEHEIDEIHLNFSDPWPKVSKANKRLTSAHFLQKYDIVLKENGKIVFKTDNTPLFDFSLKEAVSEGWITEEIDYDLHVNGNPEWNVMTDYEMQFVEKGVRIHRVVIRRGCQ